MAASLTKTQSYAVGEWEVQTSGTALTVTLVTDDYLWIRQTLSTTDPEVTPTLSLMEIELSGLLVPSVDIEVTAIASIGIETFKLTCPSVAIEVSAIGATEISSFKIGTTASIISAITSVDLNSDKIGLTDIGIISLAGIEIQTSKLDITPINLDVSAITSIDLNSVKIGLTDFIVSAEGSLEYTLLKIVTAEVVTLDATDITPTSAKLNGELVIFGSHVSLDVYFEYRESGEVVWDFTPSQEMLSIGVFEYNLEGLDTNRLYEFRAVVAW